MPEHLKRFVLSCLATAVEGPALRWHCTVGGSALGWHYTVEGSALGWNCSFFVLTHEVVRKVRGCCKRKHVRLHAGGSTRAYKQEETHALTCNH
eukprot:1158960-Pelagomonas_calceolata.AAC.9